MSAATAVPRRAPSRGQALLVAGVLALAVIEAANALWAPFRAPSDADWRGAAAAVRAGFRPGDLVVAAPAWADQVMRLHLGDLVPLAVAGRMDDARFGRVWEVSQRGARSPEAHGEERVRSAHGNLLVRLVERPAARVTYDFLARWQDAVVVRREPGRDVPCSKAPDRFACPNVSFNFVRPALLEIGGTLRNALYAQPVGQAAVVITFPAVPLGNELAFAAGLHHVWLRKGGTGHVTLKVFVGGQLVSTHDTGNRTGFSGGRADTTAFAGQTQPVRFEITSEAPFSRHFGFVAEARSR